MSTNKRSAGFTLIELMLVVVVIGILASLAYSSYSDYVTRSRRAEAFAALEQMAGALEKNFTIRSFYVSSNAVNAFTAPTTFTPPVFSSTVPLDGGTAYYNLTVRSPTRTTFTIRATPTGVQAGDGTIEMDNDMSKRWDQNADGDFTDPGEDDWKKD